MIDANGVNVVGLWVDDLPVPIPFGVARPSLAVNKITSVFVLMHDADGGEIKKISSIHTTREGAVSAYNVEIDNEGGEIEPDGDFWTIEKFPLQTP